MSNKEQTVITLELQAQLLRKIKNFVTNTNKTARDKRTVEFFDTRLKTLDQYWASFVLNEESLVFCINDPEYKDNAYFKEDQYDEGELAYAAACAETHAARNEKLAELSTAQAPLAAPTSPNNAIFAQPMSHSTPKVTIPTFDGTQSAWDGFKELFTAIVIKDSRITDIVKLQHLLNNVTGTAEQALKGVSVSHSNFNVAWDKLLRRFDGNKRRLHCYLETLIDLPKLSKESASGLSLLIDKTEESVKGLAQLECPIDHYDNWFVHLMVKKLDPRTKKDWAIHEEGVEGFSTYKNLLRFLEHRVESLNDPSNETHSHEASTFCPTPSKNTQSSSNKKGPRNPITAHYAQNTDKPKGKNTRKCIFCSEQHSLFRCAAFNKLKASDRIKFIKSKNRCTNCFSDKHTSNCPSQYSCNIDGCGGKHHSLLHIDRSNVHAHTTQPGFEPSCSTQSSPQTVHNRNHADSYCAFSEKSVLLSTAKIILRNQMGDSIIVNALIDTGSMRSFVTGKVVSALHLKTKSININIKGVGDTLTSRAEAFCQLTLGSRSDPTFQFKFDALVLDKLTSQLPPKPVKISSWSHLKNLNLADPEFMKPKDIDCILGAEAYARIALPDVKPGSINEPLAQSTRLGWILVGATITDTSDFVDTCFTNSYFVQSNDNISNALVKQWEIEKIPPKVHSSVEDETCEEHFVNTHFKIEGRYGVRLPFKCNPSFPGSKEIAVSSWTRLEKRLAKNPELKRAYDNFMFEYLKLNHMEPVPKTELIKPDVYYIPHHAVFHNNKIRVVFNASMPSKNGTSLNACLHTGPKLQQDLVLVLIQWRWYRYVFVTDIVKMFRQVLVHVLDRDWLRIVYDFGSGLQHFRLCTVTYGTAPAPYQSLRVLRQILTDFLHRFGASIRESLVQLFHALSYVDDFFGGADTIKQLLEIRDALIKILALAKIELGKWSANDPSILTNLKNINQRDRPLEVHEVTSTLGLKWSPSLDVFSFQASQETVFPSQRKKEITKRIVLSEKSKLFDPLGWISPVLIPFTIFCQDLWIDGLEWDTPLKPEFLITWERLKLQVHELETIQIPRWIGATPRIQWSLHGFADASKRAYSACIYFVPNTGQASLICCKTKVAPVNTQSITRLELMAAQLLARLIEYVSPSFVLPPHEIHCWSDSRNVLCLLKTVPAKLKVFEANRVSDIITILPRVRWKYVPTSQNPADFATRGMSARELKKCSIWWSGPLWLNTPTNWPDQLDLIDSEISSLIAEPIPSTEELRICILEKFSSFNKLVRVVATLLRWTPARRQNRSTPLSAEELTYARMKVLQFDQSIHFPKEVSDLQNKRQIARKSSIAFLRPFLDPNGLLRVGSRIEECPSLTYNEKYPIILGKRSSISRALASDYHRLCLHGGPQLVLSAIARKYFIVCGKRVIKSISAQCSRCLRYSGRCLSQQMATLPRDRLVYEYPFATTGLDYAGPIKITPSRGRGISSSKGYICIFICLSTRAIHVEIVSDLTTKAFLAAFERFTSRRNLPKQIRSDQGTTFVGAEREIREKLFSPNSLQFQKIKEYTGNLEISWSFSPPYGPHFGGIWEAAVKSFKHHFKRVLGETSLTFEEHSTLAAQIEACLNSRPLCTISPNGRDPIPLTPGHFLVGRPLKTLPPESEVSDTTRSYQDRYTLLLAMRNSFWGKWKKEVLHQMSQSNKWHFPQRNLQVGDLVFMMDESSPPSCWPLARVTSIGSNRSGLVRSVTIKTSESSYDRPIHKLVYLPFSEPAQQAYHAFISGLVVG